MKRSAKWTVLACATVTAAVVCLAVAQMRPGSPPHQPMPPHQPGQPGRPGTHPGGPGGMPGVQKMTQFIGVLQHLTKMSFSSEAVAVVAVGGLKDDVRRKPAEIIKDLEAQLDTVKTQGIRNAVRLSLKDLYKKQGEDAKCIGQLKLLIAENDKALQARKK